MRVGQLAICGIFPMLLAFGAAAAAAPNDDFVNCIYPDTQRPEYVIDVCSKLVSLQTDDENARAMVLLSRGNMYRRTGEFDRAIADYDQALQITPDSAAVHTSRGNAWRGKGAYDRALADHTKAIRLDQNYAEAFSNRGNVYADKRDYDRAIADYNKAIALKRDYAVAYYNRGLAWRAKGDRGRAAEDYRAALKLDAHFAQAAAALKAVEAK